MISAVRELGHWQRAINRGDNIDTLIKDPNMGDEGKVLLLKINLDENAYDGLEIEDYDPEKQLEYLYRGGVPMGPCATPSARITEAQKTFENKILSWFKNYYILGLINQEEQTFLDRLKNVIEKEKLETIAKLEDTLAGISKKTKTLLTLKIKSDGKWLYIGNFPVFKKLLEGIIGEKAAGGAGEEQNYCSLCHEKKKVSGNTDVFKFYTIDKPGFIVGGFSDKSAWKNFPVCLDCKFDLEEGKKYLERKLQFNFYGLRYSLIPKFMVGEVGAQEEIVERLVEAKKELSLKDRSQAIISNDNEEILEEISRQKDIMTVNLLFIQKPMGSSAERIVLLIEDVFPSRIREIFKAKATTDEIFEDVFNFRRIRDFFGKSDANKKETDLDKYFLEIINKIFHGIGLDFGFLIRFYLQRIRKEFVNDGYFMPTVKSAMMDTCFFEQLGLLKFKEGEEMESSVFDPVFSRYTKALNLPQKRGIFLLGSLVQILLNKQHLERNAAPFANKLKGLKLNERDVRALLPQVRQKLEEYSAYDKGKQLIAEAVSKDFMISGDNWKMPADEVNYYLVCGMSLYKEVAGVIYPKDAKPEENLMAEVE